MKIGQKEMVYYNEKAFGEYTYLEADNILLKFRFKNIKNMQSNDWDKRRLNSVYTVFNVIDMKIVTVKNNPMFE
jgi:hypothetical protein